MNTRNTIQTKCGDALTEAVFTLETLSHPDCILIVKHLTIENGASLLDLSVHTGLDANLLEEKLEKLERMRIVHAQGNLYGNRYRLNRERLARISAIVQKLI